MFEDQLFLIIGFKNHGVFVEPFDLSQQFYTANQKNGDWCFVAAHGVEVDVLNIL